MRGPALKKKKIIIAAVTVLVFSVPRVLYGSGEAVFSDEKSKSEFAAKAASMIETAWKTWQDGIVINNVEVNGGQGRIAPGGMGGSVVTREMILSGLSLEDITDEKMKYFTTVAGAVADSMRVWQREYYNEYVPFPEGASSSFSLTPCVNVPVSLSSGISPGERRINSGALYDHMLYHSQGRGDDIKAVFAAAAEAFCLVFYEWKDNCFIEGITASGGISPTPSPLNMGPGPVCGAKGSGGKLKGDYFNGRRMYDEMVLSLSKKKPDNGPRP